MTAIPPGIAALNREALAPLVAATPALVDCVPTGEAPSLAARGVLLAGSPIAWAAVCPHFRGAIEALARARGVA